MTCNHKREPGIPEAGQDVVFECKCSARYTEAVVTVGLKLDLLRRRGLAAFAAAWACSLDLRLGLQRARRVLALKHCGI